jgi:hypothetical protein
VWLTSAAMASDLLGEEPHAELEVGFLVGDRSFGEVPFERADQGRPLAGLDGPFLAYPLSDSLVTGPRAEVRAVAPPLRVSLGYQRPYPDWAVAVPDVADRDGADVPVLTSVRALRTDEVALGLGLEAPTGVMVPFADLLGTVHRSSVALEVDGRPAHYTSEAFSLSGRGGLRLQVADHLFVQASGQATFLGPATWGASVGIGVAAY